MTITAKEPRASESNHWYTREGVPRYTVIGANGKERNTTLRDARKESLVPSVTTILNVAAKPALNQWLQKQVLMAALTLPRRPDEPEEEWIARIMDDSKEQGRNAADVGSEIHAAIQSFYEGTVYKGHEQYVAGCVDAIRSYFNDWAWVSERAFAHEIGFGGKCDLHVPATPEKNFEGFVVDIKTKEFTDPDKVEGYDEHLMQLSAYRIGLGMPNARCANVFVSRSVPGLVKIIEWDQDDLKRGWEMFHALLTFWQTKNQHK
jgi:hypothetical protein